MKGSKPKLASYLTKKQTRNGYMKMAIQNLNRGFNPSAFSHSHENGSSQIHTSSNSPRNSIPQEQAPLIAIPNQFSSSFNRNAEITSNQHNPNFKSPQKLSHIPNTFGNRTQSISNPFYKSKNNEIAIPQYRNNTQAQDNSQNNMHQVYQNNTNQSQNNLYYQNLGNHQQFSQNTMNYGQINCSFNQLNVPQNIHNPQNHRIQHINDYTFPQNYPKQQLNPLPDSYVTKNLNAYGKLKSMLDKFTFAFNTIISELNHGLYQQQNYEQSCNNHQEDHMIGSMTYTMLRCTQQNDLSLSQQQNELLNSGFRHSTSLEADKKLNRKQQQDITQKFNIYYSATITFHQNSQILKEQTGKIQISQEDLLSFIRQQECTDTSDISKQQNKIEYLRILAESKLIASLYQSNIILNNYTIVSELRQIKVNMNLQQSSSLHQQICYQLDSFVELYVISLPNQHYWTSPIIELNLINNATQVQGLMVNSQWGSIYWSQKLNIPEANFQGLRIEQNLFSIDCSYLIKQQAIIHLHKISNIEHSSSNPRKILNKICSQNLKISCRFQMIYVILLQNGYSQYKFSMSPKKQKSVTF